MITVPACIDCNQLASMDDEYFRLNVAMRHDVGDHPDAQSALQSALRGMRYPQAAGLKTSFLKTIQLVSLRSPAGLYLGKTASYRPEPDRLCAVVRQTMLGLFYRHAGHRLPDTHNSAAYLHDAIEPDTEIRATLEQMITGVQSAPLHIVGRRVLMYKYRFLAEDPDASAWLFLFYQRVGFLGITVPKVAPPDGNGES